MEDKHYEYLNRLISCQMKIKEDLERIGDIKRDCEYQSVKDQIFLLTCIREHYVKTTYSGEPVKGEVDMLLDTIEKSVQSTREELKKVKKIQMSSLYGKFATTRKPSI